MSSTLRRHFFPVCISILSSLTLLGGFVPTGKWTSNGKCCSQKWDYISFISQFMSEAKIFSTTLLQTFPRRRKETRQSSGGGGGSSFWKNVFFSCSFFFQIHRIKLAWKKEKEWKSQELDFQVVKLTMFLVIWWKIMQVHVM